MRVIRIDLEYDGTAFHGFAPQPGARTIGGELSAALGRLLGESVRLSAGGRTDAGVHARGQVVSFTTEATRPASELKHPLNAMLGDDMWIRAVADAPVGFDARRSAWSRRYDYAIWNAADRNLWERHVMLHVADPLDVEAMKQACRALIGRHDFAAFRTHRSQDDTEKGTVRRILAAEWRREPTRDAAVHFEIEGDAFLRHMVRTIVGSAIQVGLRKEPVESIERMLQGKVRAGAGPTAPAQGLTLLEVTYQDAPEARLVPVASGSLRAAGE
jgi:tRNA pseudouridine38-40 synthase